MTYCNKTPLPLPVSKGGLTTEDNLQTLCWRCNRSKGAKSNNNKKTAQLPTGRNLRSLSTTLQHMILLLPRQENYLIHPAKTQFDKGVFFVPFFKKG